MKPSYNANAHKSMAFTFKTTKPTGAYSAFYHPRHDIKLRKQVVGAIDDGTWDIRFMVYKTATITDDNPNCNWMWVRIKHKSQSLQAAKDWLAENADLILSTYSLRPAP